MRLRTIVGRGSSRFTAYLTLLLATGTPTPLLAQVTTGKVQGRVTDALTGEPIAMATVLIEGTTLGNITNEAGFFFINDVPAGLQSVRARYIGFRSLVIEAQRILAGQTTTLNFELEQTAVELEALSVQGERNPLVPRDQMASKAIVQGQAIDLLPLDNVTQIVLLQPGVYEELGCIDLALPQGPSPTGCLTIRGGRPNEEAVYLDGVLVRSFGTGRAGTVQVPTNSLEQLDVTVGAFSAEFGEAQSGVISYVTRRGGTRFTGAAEFHTDALGPRDWYTGFNRLEANIGGPVYGPLTFFLAGTATGQDWFQNEGMPDRFVIDGTDTCPASPQFEGLCEAGEPAVFRTSRTTVTPGAADSVDLAAPSFVRWEDGRTVPGDFTDELLFTGNVNLQLPRGSRVSLGYTRNRFQDYSSVSDWWSQFRQDNVEGVSDNQNIFSVNGYLTLLQTSTQQLALEVRGSYQSSRFRSGMADPLWYLEHRDPWLGFTPASIDFVIDEDVRRYGIEVFRPTEEFVQAWRSGAIQTDSLVLYPGRGADLGGRETVAGLNHNLRSNPWGWYYGYFISGVGASGLSVRNEDVWQVRTSLDWQAGRFNRLKLGGEYLSVDMSSMELWMFAATGNPNLASPVRAGLFVQDRLDVGDLVLEAGLRWDYLDPDAEYPRYPGYVADVPDSLQAGFVKWDSEQQAFIPKFEVPCGGVTPENPSGTCLDNFIPMTAKSEFSPRLGASFPVTPISTFRLSYGRFVQTPAFFSFGNTFTQSLGAAQVDLLGSDARDVEMPSTSAFEFGYRQLIGQDLVLDLAAFYKKQRAGLTYRQVESINPNSGLPQFATVLTNQDFTESTGFELKIDKVIGNLFVGNLAYSYLDARGTGTDPYTYLNLINSQRTNLSFLTGEPVNPPETLLPLELGRRHNITLTTSLQFPADYGQGTLAGAILRDFGLFTLLSIRSGQRYTGFEYEGGYGNIGPPSGGGQVRTSLGALETPWQTQIDFRFSKGFQIGKGWLVQAFVDWRNPFDIAVTRQVFLETGDTVNEAARERWLNDALADPRLDGDSNIDDFDIALESPETDFNKYMLMRAEQRWGNGDGVFTVEEQTRAFEPDWDQYGGTATLRPSNQSLRLGLRVSF